MRRLLGPLLALLAPLALTYCGDTDLNSVPVTTHASVNMLDQCDSASFNAGLGAGTCTRQGGVTLSQFNAELRATGSVSAWRFDPASLTLRMGSTITATNQGGEKHTFTEVKQFGGGIVPALNSASGNPVAAPECTALSNSDLVAPGGTFTTNPQTQAGTHLYQCCIHPWMRATVTVTGS